MGVSALGGCGSSSVVSLGIRWRRPNVETSGVGGVDGVIVGSLHPGLGSGGGGCGGEVEAGGIFFDR